METLMAITKDVIKVVQSELNKRYNLNLVVDGVDGKNTQDALNAPGMDPGWPAERRLVDSFNTSQRRKVSM